MRTQTFDGKSVVRVHGVCNVAGVGHPPKRDVERGVKKARSGFRPAVAAVLILTAGYQLGSGLEARHLAWAAEHPRGTAAVTSPVANLAKADSAAQTRVVQSYGKLPLAFEANQGQTDARVKFVSRGSGYTLFLTGDEAVLTLTKSGGRSQKPGVGPGKLPSRVPSPESRTPAVLRMQLTGANSNATVKGADELPGKANYFIGNDPKKWRTNVPTYAKVKYEGVYPGVNLVYYGNQGQLEYDFVVAPGADASALTLRFAGSRRVHVDRKTGDLLVRAGKDLVRFKKPLVYQIAPDNGPRTTDRALVEGHYKLTYHNRVAFELGPYDRARPLVIDPVLTYSTYLGGSGYDAANGVTVDTSGEAFITGFATSANFPVTTGAFQTSCGGGNCASGDAFVTKLNASGSALVYSTYLGGSSQDEGGSIAINNEGDAYLTGLTLSSDFPVTAGAFQTACDGCNPSAYIGDAFVTEISATGSALVYSTFLGGSGADYGVAITLDASANAYVTGATFSDDFPTTAGAFQTSCGGGSCDPYDDAFVTELNPGGTSLIYSTYLGGSNYDSGYGLSVDTSGSVYVTGYTISSDFPVTPGAFQTTCSQNCDFEDAFITKLNPTGSALVYSTYLGGDGQDFGYGITVDSGGNAYLTGTTTSFNFPVTPGAFQNSFGSAEDAFVTKLNSTGTALVYSTYLGGTNQTGFGTLGGNGIGVDSAGDAYVVGTVDVPTFPVVDPIQAAFIGGPCNTYPCFDVFVTELNPTGTGLVFSSYLGGTGYDEGSGLALDGANNIYLVGLSTSIDFLTTAAAFKLNCLTCSGANGELQMANGFVSKISPASLPGVSLAPWELSFSSQTIGTTSAPQALVLHNVGSATLEISSIMTSGDFGQTNNCGSSLTGGSSCTVSVTFTPTESGTRTGTVTVTDNASDSPESATLSGTGVGHLAVAISPAHLAFPSQLIFTPSQPQNVTLKNTGNVTLTITSIATAGSFRETNDCGATVPAGATCSIRVTFQPDKKGAETGSLMVTDNVPGSPQTVSLRGAGTVVQFTPVSLDFGGERVGQTSPPATVTLTNLGMSPLTVSTISITGTDSGDFAQTNTCGSSIASGASCSITVTFTPLAKGKRTASVSVTDNGGGSPQTVSLSGTGT